MSIFQGLLPNFPKREKFQEKYIKNQRNRSFQITEDGPHGARGRPGDMLARTRPRSRQEAAWVGPTSSGSLLWPIFSPSRGNPSTTSRIANFSIVPPSQRFRDRER
uniref:Predicted protein n=1 Tax=Hordeum vulgare subsp. vulgare TaxID=112509 RepID=F2EBT5_HORVV|nr:predicted protein [Hordeum vulgare subsp. vulgare]